MGAHGDKDQHDHHRDGEDRHAHATEQGHGVEDGDDQQRDERTGQSPRSDGDEPQPGDIADYDHSRAACEEADASQAPPVRLKTGPDTQHRADHEPDVEGRGGCEDRGGDVSNANQEQNECDSDIVLGADNRQLEGTFVGATALSADPDPVRLGRHVTSRHGVSLLIRSRVR